MDCEWMIISVISKSSPGLRPHRGVIIFSQCSSLLVMFSVITKSKLICFKISNTDTSICLLVVWGVSVACLAQPLRWSFCIWKWICKVPGRTGAELLQKFYHVLFMLIFMKRTIVHTWSQRRYFPCGLHEVELADMGWGQFHLISSTSHLSIPILIFANHFYLLLFRHK